MGVKTLSAPKGFNKRMSGMFSALASGAVKNMYNIRKDILWTLPIKMSVIKNDKPQKSISI